MSAKDDIKLVWQPDPDLPDRQMIIARNLNQDKSVVASLVAISDHPYPIQDLNGGSTVRVFPHSWEVRIPPGSAVFASRSQIRRYTAYGWGPGNQQWEDYAVHVDVSGGRYVSDEPLPLPAADDIRNLVGWYYLPYGTTSQAAAFFVNLGHVYGVSASLFGPNHPGQHVSLELPPFYHKLLWAKDRDILPIGWTAKNVRFYPYQVVDLGLPN